MILSIKGVDKQTIGSAISKKKGLIFFGFHKLDLDISHHVDKLNFELLYSYLFFKYITLCP